MDDIKDKATEVIDNYHYDGPARVNLDELQNKLGISSKKFFGILGANAAQRNTIADGLTADLEKFMSSYNKDPDKAVKMLLGGSKGAKADLIAELAAKLKPEAAEKFKDLGIDINGKIGNAVTKAVDAATNATAEDATEKIEKMMSDVEIDGNKLKYFNSPAIYH